MTNTRSPSDFYAISQAMDAFGCRASADYYRQRALDAAHVECLNHTARASVGADTHCVNPERGFEPVSTGREARADHAEYSGQHFVGYA